MKRAIASALSFCLVLPIPAPAFQQSSLKSGDLSVSADVLGSLILGEKIKLMLRDGTYVEGKVLRATRDTIVMKISKAEPKERIKSPEASLATADISVVYMRRNGPVSVPIALGVAGGILGFISGVYATEEMHNTAAYMSISIAMAAGGATGGALLGRQAVRKTVTIFVTKESEVRP